MSQQREIEWQLSAPDLPAVRRWLHEHSSLADLQIEPCAPIHLHDTYLDTDDWRFHRAGFALRARTSSAGGEATLKSLHAPRSGAADRIEVSEALSSGGPESVGAMGGDVGRRVRAVTGKQPLRRLFEIHTARERFAVRRDGTDLGEIALDDTRIGSTDGRPDARIRRVEVEAHDPDTLQPLEHLVDALRSGCSLERASDSKYVAGLGAAGLTPPASSQLAPPTSDPRTPVSEFARAQLRRRLFQWAAHEPGARLGEDPKRLHDLRVAGRQIDVVLRLFEIYLPRKLSRTRRGLKKLLRALGAARDVDVQLQTLADMEADLSADERSALTGVRERLRSERERALARMLKLLDSPSGLRWLHTLERYLATAGAVPARRAQRQPAGVVLPDIVRRSYRKVRKAADSLTTDSSPEQYHRMRRRTKRMRYLLDACSGIYGESVQELLTATRRMQNRLGEQQDAHVAMQQLSVLAHARSPKLPSSAAFLLGRLAERQRNAAREARDRFAPAWRKVRGKRWKRVRRALKETRKSLEPAAEAPARASLRHRRRATAPRGNRRARSGVRKSRKPDLKQESFP